MKVIFELYASQFDPKYRTSDGIGHKMNARAGFQDGNMFELDEELVFAWAQEHKDNLGAYPSASSGPVVSTNSDTADVTWAQINNLLYKGFNGLPPKLRLRTFIESMHRVYSPLSEEKIIVWANEHKRRHNAFPTPLSGGVEHRDADGDTWASINGALMLGQRGLDGYRTLQELFSEHEASKNLLTEEMILSYADEFCLTYGAYPNVNSIGEVDIPGLGKKRWKDVDRYLMNGMHGLPKRRPRDSLLDFLSRHRAADQLKPAQAKLTIKRIIGFALAHLETHGELPHALSGKVVGTHSETWMDIESALRNGGRGFAGGSSLQALLAEYMPVAVPEHSQSVDSVEEYAETSFSADLTVPVIAETAQSESVVPAKKNSAKSKLNLDRVLAWLDKHKASEGYYPLSSDDKIPGGYGRTWADLERSLLAGDAGTEAQLELADFVRKFRPRKAAASMASQGIGIRPNETLQSHTEEIEHSSTERVLPTAQSLAFSRPSFAGKASGSHPTRQESITLSNVLQWIDNYHEAHGEFPRVASGKIEETSGISWKSVAKALEEGRNDLPQCDSLSKFIYQQYGMIGKKLIGKPRHMLRHMRS